MENDPANLTPKRVAAVTALLSTSTQAEAARVAGVRPRTLRRWLAEPAFAEAVRQARHQAFEQATGRLQQLAVQAADTLGELLTNAPAHVRATAALGILKQAREAIELDDLNERIERIEQQQEDRQR